MGEMVLGGSRIAGRGMPPRLVSGIFVTGASWFKMLQARQSAIVAAMNTQCSSA